MKTAYFNNIWEKVDEDDSDVCFMVETDDVLEIKSVSILYEPLSEWIDVKNIFESNEKLWDSLNKQIDREMSDD